MKTEIYDITGMHCAACSSAVERVTRKLPGVTESNVNLTMARLTITYDENQTTEKMICDKVNKAGFGAFLHVESQATDTAADDDSDSKEDREKLISLIVSVVFAALLMIVSMGHMFGMPLPAIVDSHANPQNFALLQFLLVLPIIILGKHYYVSGLGSLLRGNPNMNTLVAISSVASLAYSLVLTFMLEAHPELVHNLYYESSAVVVALVSVGKYMESRSESKTKSALKGLARLAPDHTNLFVDGVIKSVPTSTVNVGDVILIRAGERIPLDATVIEGFGSSDESMLTGESLPVDKESGSSLIGGSLLLSGALYARVTKIGGETMLAKIIKLVEDAQGKKAPISKVADKVAGVFVPIVMAISVLMGVIWLIAGEGIGFALKIFTSVLVIACPCAMGLATPTAIMVGTGVGATRGILIRSGEALEMLHSVNVVVFDKTGTVTEGKMRLSDVVTKETDEAKLLSILNALESLSDHPIARAITEACNVRDDIITHNVSNFENFNGMGLKGQIDGVGEILAGNKRLMSESQINLDDYLDTSAACADEGKTLIYVAVNGKAIGFVTVSDTIKSSAKNAVAVLKSMNIETVLLTGDNASAANAIAAEAGFDKVYAEVLPIGKADVVSGIKAEGKCVMMVGDGINDAPALTSADIGVAIGNGSDIAIDSAQVILMKDDPEDACRAIKLGKYTIKNIKQNLFWAFCYNVLAIPIAAGLLYPIWGLTLTPMIGSIAMSLSSLFVVTNALSLSKKKID